MIFNWLKFSFLILTVLLVTTVKANVRILSIGVSKYPENSGWNTLNAHNDIALISSISKNPIILEDSQATYQNINSSFKKILSSAELGDTIIVHFSGHGQQILTENSNQEIDGIDEALVPYNACKNKSAVYQGQYHYTDDEFGEQINNLREKVGSTGLVIALLDACHSDSMDRDPGKNNYRGTEEIFGADLLSSDEIKELRDKYDLEDNNSLTGNKNWADVIYISACGSHQRNYEIEVDGKTFGSLSYYFYKAYTQKGLLDLPSFMTCLFENMTSDKVMKFHGQEPVIRNTVGWSKPIDDEPIIYDPKPRNPRDNKLSPLAIVAISIGGFILIFLISYLICKKKRK